MTQFTIAQNHRCLGRQTLKDLSRCTWNKNFCPSRGKGASSFHRLMRTSVTTSTRFLMERRSRSSTASVLRRIAWSRFSSAGPPYCGRKASFSKLSLQRPNIHYQQEDDWRARHVVRLTDVEQIMAHGSGYGVVNPCLGTCILQWRRPPRNDANP